MKRLKQPWKSLTFRKFPWLRVIYKSFEKDLCKQNQTYLFKFFSIESMHFFHLPDIYIRTG